MTPEQADRSISIELRRRSADWVRRFTVEQCALIAERAADMQKDNGAPVTKAEMARRALRVAKEIRAVLRPPASTDAETKR